MTIAGATVSNPRAPVERDRAPTAAPSGRTAAMPSGAIQGGGGLPASNPNRVPYPFGPNQLAWLDRFMPIAQYGARCVKDSDALAARAREMANG